MSAERTGWRSAHLPLETAKAAGITENTLARYERNDDIAQRSVQIYLNLSDALSVKVSDLIRSDYPDLIDRTSMMKSLPSRGENLQNPIACYRRIQRLTYEELAVRLGRTPDYRIRKCLFRYASVEISKSGAF